MRISTVLAALSCIPRVSRSQIAAGTITAANIAANTITATQIAAGTITTAGDPRVVQLALKLLF